MSLLLDLLLPKIQPAVSNTPAPPPAVKASTGEKHVYWHKERRCFYISIRDRNKKIFKSGLKTLKDAVAVRNALLAKHEKHDDTAS